MQPGCCPGSRLNRRTHSTPKKDYYSPFFGVIPNGPDRSSINHATLHLRGYNVPMNDTSTQPTAPSGGSFLPWSWTRIPRLTSVDVVVQVNEDGCGPARRSMLLKDRGVLVCQTTIAEAITLPVDGPALANRLSALSDYRWMGGALDLDRDPGWAVVACITELRGS